MCSINHGYDGMMMGCPHTHTQTLFWLTTMLVKDPRFWQPPTEVGLILVQRMRMVLGRSRLQYSSKKR